MPKSNDVARLHSIQKLLKQNVKSNPSPMLKDYLWLCAKLEIEWSSYIASFSAKLPATAKTDGSLQPVDYYGFTEFKAAYPKPVGRVMQWGPAKKEWLKLKPGVGLRGRIMTSLEAQKKSWDWMKEDGKFIPNPEKWIKKEGWESEVGLFVKKIVPGEKCATCGYNGTLHNMKAGGSKDARIAQTLEKVCDSYLEREA